MPLPTEAVALQFLEIMHVTNGFFLYEAKHNITNFKYNFDTLNFHHPPPSPPPPPNLADLLAPGPRFKSVGKLCADDTILSITSHYLQIQTSNAQS